MGGGSASPLPGGFFWKALGPGNPLLSPRPWWAHGAPRGPAWRVAPGTRQSSRGSGAACTAPPGHRRAEAKGGLVIGVENRRLWKTSNTTRWAFWGEHPFGSVQGHHQQACPPLPFAPSVTLLNRCLVHQSASGTACFTHMFTSSAQASSNLSLNLWELGIDQHVCHLLPETSRVDSAPGPEQKNPLAELAPSRQQGSCLLKRKNCFSSIGNAAAKKDSA